MIPLPYFRNHTGFQSVYNKTFRTIFKLWRFQNRFHFIPATKMFHSNRQANGAMSYHYHKRGLKVEQLPRFPDSLPPIRYSVSEDSCLFP